MTAQGSSSIANPGNFLRTSRNFPAEIQPLTVEINKAYVDIANQVNDRISAIFGTVLTITGESWFLDGQAGRQNSLRQVYVVTATGTYVHGINFQDMTAFSRMYGQYTDGTYWYGLIPASNTAIAGQVSFYLDNTNINVIAGAGAPSLTYGLIILEYISQV